MDEFFFLKHSELNEPSFDMETVSYCIVAALLGSNRTGIKQICI